ncbi:MAG: glycine cleavage system protein GcvH [Bacillota bacterium]|jgi:glycine cleavage system H protein
MELRENLYYSRTHEWVRVEGEKAYVGITDYAQQELGDIVFVELPDEDAEFAQDDRLAVVESVKAAADIHAPLSGRVVEVNTALEDDPEEMNRAAFDAWIAVIEMQNPEELKNLMSAEEYRQFVTEN